MNRLACALGDADVPGDLAVALPEGRLAGQERIVRRRLDLAVGGGRPRGDRVLAGGGVPQSSVQKIQANSLASPPSSASPAARPSSIRTSTLAIGAPQAAPMIW